MMAALDSLGTVKPSLTIKLFFAFGPLFPRLFSRLSNQRNARIKALVKSVETIAEGVLARIKVERDDVDGERDQSIISSLSESFFVIYSTPTGFVERIVVGLYDG